jgi:transcriptional regulator with XRE-family HTH domain
MFKEIFIKLCSEKGVSPSTVCREVGITPATYSGWNENSVPRKTTLLRISEYFGVSVGYLLGEPIKEKAPTGVTDESEDELLKRTILYLEENGYIQKPEYEKLKELSEEERAVIAALRRVSDEKRSMAITMILSALNSQ